jgi:hypothetical protein
MKMKPALKMKCSLSLALSLCACGLPEIQEEVSTPENSGACSTATLSLVNGLESSEHPAVGLFLRLNSMRTLAVGACTGTFVDSTTMITSAHCVDASENGGVIFVPGEAPNLSNPNFKSVSALKVFHLGLTHEDFVDGDSSVEVRAKDLAVVVFPEGTAPGVAGLAAARPAPGSRVTMVGYGSTQWVDAVGTSTTPRKRVGTNLVQSVSGEGFSDLFVDVGFVSAEESDAKAVDGSAAMASRGDSGGPILMNGMIAGVASQAGATGDSPMLYFASYVSPLSPEATNLFEAARKGGAVIPEPGVAPMMPVPPTELPEQKAKSASPATQAPDCL